MTDPVVPPTEGRRCPSCGNRVAFEGMDRSPEETLCTPISCAAWRTEAVYDWSLGRFVEIPDDR